MSNITQKWYKMFTIICKICQIWTTETRMIMVLTNTNQSDLHNCNEESGTFHGLDVLILAMLNKDATAATTNQITWSRLLIQIHILNDKQSRSRSICFWQSQLIWIYTFCKSRTYQSSAGPGLKWYHITIMRWSSSDNLNAPIHLLAQMFLHMTQCTDPWQVSLSQIMVNPLI